MENLLTAVMHIVPPSDGDLTAEEHENNLSILTEEASGEW